MTCLIEDCDRKPKTRGLCGMHYEQWRRGRLNVEPLPYKELRKCSVEGCERVYHSHNFCEMHSRRFRRTGDPQADLPPRFDRVRKPCSVEGCGRDSKARGLCKTHWDRWHRLGDVMADVPIGPSGRKHGDDCPICEESAWAAENYVPSSRIVDAYQLTERGLRDHLARHKPGLLSWYYGTCSVAS